MVRSFCHKIGLLVCLGLCCPPDGEAAESAGMGIKAWPLLYSASDPVLKEQRLELLWPLYIRKETPAYTANQWLSFPQQFPESYPQQYYVGWPLSGLRLAPDGHDAWFFPSWWSGREAGRSHYVLFPAFYYTHYGSGRTLNLGGLLHHYWEPEKRNSYLLPLLWSCRTRAADGQRRDSHALLPFGAAYHRLDKESWHQWEVEQWERWLVPVYWGGEERRSAAVKGAAAQRHVGLPLVMHASWEAELNLTTKSAKSGDALWLFPWFQSQRTTLSLSGSGTPVLDGATLQMPDDAEAKVTEEYRRQALLPLFWQSRWQQQAPAEAAGTRFRQILLPLYGWNEDVSAGKHSTSFLSLLYWRRDQDVKPAGTTDTTAYDRQSSQGWFPLLWDFTDRPAAGPVERSTYLLPLGARLRRDGEFDAQNLLGPFFTRCHDQKTGSSRYDLFFPVLKGEWGGAGHAGRLFPLAGWDYRPWQHDNRWYLFPFVWSDESRPLEGEVAALSPERRVIAVLEARQRILSRSAAGASASMVVFPLWWHFREDGAEQIGLLPCVWLDRRCRLPEVDSRVWWLLPLLGRVESRQAPEAGARADLLLSALAWEHGADSRLWRFFPLFSWSRKGACSELQSWCLPFYSRTVAGNAPTGTLSIPFAWLPWFGHEVEQRRAGERHSTWLFPLFRQQQDSAAASSEWSVLWPLFSSSRKPGVSNVQALAGMGGSFESDVNGFSENRILHRLYYSRSRSWGQERQLMPFYSSSAYSDGTGNWSILGGLLGMEHGAQQSCLRVGFIPFTLGATVAPESAAAQAEAHAEFALRYLDSGRPDLAVIEFALAGNVRAQDGTYQLAAGQAYQKLQVETLDSVLCDSLPIPGSAKGGASTVEAGARSSASLVTLLGKGGRDQAKLRAHCRSRALAHLRAADQLGANPLQVKPALAKALADCGEFAQACAVLEALYRAPGSGLPAGLDYLTALLKSVDAAERSVKADAVYRELCARYPQAPILRLFAIPLRQAPTDPNALLEYLEATAWLPPVPEETAWLTRMHADDRNQGLSSWFFGGLFATGMGRDQADLVPLIAVTQAEIQLKNLLREYLAKDGGKPKAVALLDRRLRLLRRDLEFTGETEAALGTFRQEVNDLDALLIPAGLSRELATAYERALSELPSGVGVRKIVRLHRDRLQFNASSLTQWRLTAAALPGQTAAPAPVRLAATTGRYIDLDRAFPRVSGQRRSVTAECCLETTEARDTVLWLGFDHLATVELNGTTVFGPQSATIPMQDEFRIPIHLHPGTNTVVVRLTENYFNFGFYARLTSDDGHYLPGVVTSAP